MTEVILLLIMFLLIGVSLVYLIRKVHNYYLLNYHFSIWAGTCVLALSLLFFALASMAATKLSYTICIVVGVLSSLFTLIQDIRLSTVPKGIAAFVVQLFSVFSLVCILMAIVTRYLTNRILGRRSFLSRFTPGLAFGLSSSAPFWVFFQYHP